MIGLVVVVLALTYLVWWKLDWRDLCQYRDEKSQRTCGLDKGHTTGHGIWLSDEWLYEFDEEVWTR